MDNDELQTKLAQFTGTELYYRIAPNFLITDGVRYLADNAGCYWLLDAAISHLVELGTPDWFVLVRLVVQDCAAVLTLEDGNGRVHCLQTIPYTDFPPSQQVLYACWDGQHWVLMLTGEY
jgi:hypothetical protein